MKITTNYKKAVEVSKKVIGLLESKAYPFNQPDLFPDAIIPEGVERGSLEHASYLFYAVALDIGRESKSVYRRARELYRVMKFSDIHTLHPSYIELAIHQSFESPKERNGKRRLWADPVKTFISNGEKLDKWYQNDPRKIKKEDVKKTLEEITKFRSYGETNNALFLKNMVRAGIWNFPENGFPIKIDRHVIRISLGTGVIQVEGIEEIRFEKLIKPLDEVYKRVIKKENLSAIDLSDSFWTIGQYRCKENNAIHCAMDCPLRCKTRPRTDKQFTTIKLNDETRKNRINLFNWRD